MRKQYRARIGALVAVCLILGGFLSVHSQAASPPANKVQKRTAMARATGTFEVKLTPQAPEDKTAGASLGRMLIDKQFQGDLTGTSKGEMLSAMTNVKGSAGYVAMEQVSGTLQGHSGTFVLQHSATMNRGTPQLLITVLPDSGTGQLVGIDGKMTINIADGKHSYQFDYTLPESR
jgi:Protein of unknown function (DUF3224)